jgi:hypothetical protein
MLLVEHRQQLKLSWPIVFTFFYCLPIEGKLKAWQFDLHITNCKEGEDEVYELCEGLSDTLHFNLTLFNRFSVFYASGFIRMFFVLLIIYYEFRLVVRGWFVNTVRIFCIFEYSVQKSYLLGY